ncbi:hypothetical protein MD484_g8597, partial [Candolleomyces efflorescens]
MNSPKSHDEGVRDGNNAIEALVDMMYESKVADCATWCRLLRADWSRDKLKDARLKALNMVLYKIKSANTEEPDSAVAEFKESEIKYVKLRFLTVQWNTY